MKYFLIFSICLAGWAQQALLAQTPRPVKVGIMAAPADYTVIPLKGINEGQLDFSPVPFANGVMFTSNRASDKAVICQDRMTNDNFTEMYYAEKISDGLFAEPKLLEGKINRRYNDGVATLDTSETTMYFTRNNYDGKKKDGEIKLKVYQSAFDGKIWSEPTELPFNSAAFSSAHPTLSKDGRRLYFASDRPGGFGGMDIYVATLTGGSWSNPVNLGPSVNSSANEIFPHIDEEDRLYFASNGHNSMGGLDIFMTTKLEAAMEESWMEPEHLPEPVNSIWDDFGIVAENGAKKGYFTSNRDGGAGGDDIYFWKYNGIRLDPAKICVMREADGTRIEGAIVRMQDVTPAAAGQVVSLPAAERTAMTGSATLYYTDKDGLVSLLIPANAQYRFLVEKNGFRPEDRTVNASEILYSPEYCIGLKKSMLRLEGVVQNKSNANPLPGSTVQLLDKCTGKTETVSADAKGRFSFLIDCNCQYEVLGSKPDFSDDKKEVMLNMSACFSDQPYETLLALNPIKEEPAYRLGQVITLENVYYDYDKYFIRDDAATELNYVVDLMQKYPSMEIELRSHTDSRGSDSYNMKLSQNRAKAAVDYIVSRGISSSRLEPKGCGEMELKNECANGVTCSYEKHQENRPTEIKIINFDEENVRVEYKN